MSKFFELSSHSLSTGIPILESSPALDLGSLDSLNPLNSTVITHPISYTWSIWHHDRLNSKKEEIENNEIDNHYLSSTNLINFPKVNSKNNELTDEIDSIEQFWQCLSNLKPVFDIEIGTEFFFFKKDIKPLWEDKNNIKGGRWIFQIFKSDQSPRLNLNLIWEFLLIKLISGKFGNELIMKDLAGVSISIRSNKYIISVWNTNLSFEEFSNEKLNNYLFESKVDSELSNKLLKFDMFKEFDDDGDGGDDGNDVDPDDDDNSNNSSMATDNDREIFRKRRDIIGLSAFEFRKQICDEMCKIFEDVESLIKKNYCPLNNKKIRVCSKYKYSFHDKFLVTDSFNEQEHFKNKKFNHNNNNFKNKNNRNKKLFKKNDEIDDFYKKNKFYKNNSRDNNNRDNKFSELGKQRKKLEFGKDGLIVEEINMLSFGSRRKKLQNEKDLNNK